MNTNEKNKKLCLSLMHADSEDEVTKILIDAGYWEDEKAWRYYGDRETNYNAVGNQSSRPEVALVEKIVNSVDARLILECRLRGIDPEGPNAPKSIRSAVAEFFEGRSTSATAGLIREWQPGKRTKVSKGITLASTGFKPGEGNPCFTVSDCGEGQTPKMLPHTILSLDRGNKIKIQFVQGRYNMGGSGVLEFCGERSIQLVLSRRAPQLVDNPDDPTDLLWGFTIVRREDPIAGRRNSVFSYLAPINSESKPRKGDVLTFSADSMPIFPEANKPYARSSEHGTLIKLYEYSTEGFSGSHILRKGGLLQRLDIRLANVALPIRLHECRKGYRGGRASFDTILSGLEVRLDDDRTDNLEEIYSCALSIDGQDITGIIYVFKKGKDDSYRRNEGVIFTRNGQTHGHFTKAYFGRDTIKMGYLKNSILVILNCDKLDERPREQLFMPRRDTLRKTKLRTKIEDELGLILKNHPGLRALREKRRREEIGEMLEGSKPLEEVLEKLMKQDPAIAALFTRGMRLSVPFKTIGATDTDKPYQGKRYPEYFKFKNLDYGEILQRNCPTNHRARILFETDAVNEYFSRSVHPGNFTIHVVENGNEVPVTGFTLNLVNGIATLNLELPKTRNVGDVFEYITRTTDYSNSDPFINEFSLMIESATKKVKTKKKESRKPPGDKDGTDREKSLMIDLPKVIKVFENKGDGQKSWDEMDPPFDQYSALRIIPNGGGGSDENSSISYDYYVNMDNIWLNTALKNVSSEPELTRVRFANALVLTGLAMIQYDSDENISKITPEVQDDVERVEISIEDRIEDTSRALAAVLLPIIESLSGLTEYDIVQEDEEEEV